MVDTCPIARRIADQCWPDLMASSCPLSWVYGVDGLRRFIDAFLWCSPRKMSLISRGGAGGSGGGQEASSWWHCCLNCWHRTLLYLLNVNRLCAWKYMLAFFAVWWYFGGKLRNSRANRCLDSYAQDAIAILALYSPLRQTVFILRRVQYLLYYFYQIYFLHKIGLFNYSLLYFSYLLHDTACIASLDNNRLEWKREKLAHWLITVI